MEGSEMYMNVQFTNADSDSLCRAAPDVSYVEINFHCPCNLPVWSDGDGLTSTYSELNFRRDESLIEEVEVPPVTSEPGGLPLTAQTGPREQERKESIGNRSDPKICLLCLVTFALVAMVVGLSVHVSQVRQSLIASDQKYQRLLEKYQAMNSTQGPCRLQIHELNSTLESRRCENSRLDLGLNNNVSIPESKLFALESNLSVLENKLLVLESKHSGLSTDLAVQRRTQTVLRNNFGRLEQKCRALKESKAEICQLLTSRKEQACSQDWIRNEDRFYFISLFESSYEGARQYCSNTESKLLAINSNEEENFVKNHVGIKHNSYWIGTCNTGVAASKIVYKVKAGNAECGECKSVWPWSCKNSQHRFICEKPVPFTPDIPEKIQVLCQEPVEPTSIW